MLNNLNPIYNSQHITRSPPSMLQQHNILSKIKLSNLQKLEYQSHLKKDKNDLKNNINIKNVKLRDNQNQKIDNPNSTQYQIVQKELKKKLNEPTPIDTQIKVNQPILDKLQTQQRNSKFLSPNKNNSFILHCLSPQSKNNMSEVHQRKYTQKFENISYKKQSINLETKKSEIKNICDKKQPRRSQPVISQLINQQIEIEKQSKFQIENGTNQIKWQTSIQQKPLKYNKKSSLNLNSEIKNLKQDMKIPLTIQTLKKNKQLSPNFINKNKIISQIPAQKQDLKVTDFIKGKQLGAGKFGSVNIVKHKKTGFICAMKAIPKAMIKQQNIINQFIRQIKIQSCLDHPNIIKLYGFFEDKQNFYLLLELGSQGHLYSLLKEKRKFNQPTVIYIMRQLCQGLKYLHNLKIIHRDLKPENIVFQYSTVKICDFGWSVNKGGQLRSTFCGTPLYVSPEILRGQLYDQKIDIWSIGILAYELLIGDIPFEITTQDQLIKIIKEEITFPQDVEISIQAKDFILKILKKNPNERLKIEKLLQHPFLQRQIEQNSVKI